MFRNLVEERPPGSESYTEITDDLDIQPKTTVRTNETGSVDLIFGIHGIDESMSPKCTLGRTTRIVVLPEGEDGNTIADVMNGTVICTSNSELTSLNDIIFEGGDRVTLGSTVKLVVRPGRDVTISVVEGTVKYVPSETLLEGGQEREEFEIKAGEEIFVDPLEKTAERRPAQFDEEDEKIIRERLNVQPPPQPKPTSTPTPGPAAPISQSIVSWWSGDDDANDIVNDNHGTLMGEATTSDSKIGLGFDLAYLDGAGDFVLVPDSADLDITGDITVELWASRHDWGGNPLTIMVTKGAGKIGVDDLPRAYELGFDKDDHPYAQFKRADGSGSLLFDPQTQVTDIGYHHYAYVRSGNTHKLFMDGDVVERSTFTDGPQNTFGLPLTIGALRTDSGPLDIGPPGFNFYFQGFIDEVTIYDRALSDAEIGSIYEAGDSGKTEP